ncbi:hypothetical protein [Hyphomonas sp.]|uniref:hypothetical protein n=1 Tax=Hyphomonas sp. TaxID=87 RepID=UPI00391C9F9E
MTQKSIRGLMMALGLAAAAACASSPAAAPAAPGAFAAEQPGLQWRRIIQTEQRFSVYISEPAVREGDIVRFRMVYVYQPGAVSLYGREVAWQEYDDVRLDCAAERVVMGNRTRYAVNGEAFGQDADNTSAQIIGHAVFRSQDVHCKAKPWTGMNLVSGGPGWIARARAAILEDSPL